MLAAAYHPGPVRSNIESGHRNCGLNGEVLKWNEFNAKCLRYGTIRSGALAKPPDRLAFGFPLTNRVHIATKCEAK